MDPNSVAEVQEDTEVQEEEADEEEEGEWGFIDLDEDGCIKYEGVPLNTECRSFPGAFSLQQEQEVLQLLTADCQRAFTARAQRRDGDYSDGDTFFLKAGEAPTTAIETLVTQVFDFHTKGCTFDADNSGAEWWAQYIMDEDDIGLHFDKDYSAEEHGINLFPHVATVTYLSDIGGPTMVLDRKGPFLYGSDVSGSVGRCHLSLPQVGKHFSFNGRLLHGAPSELRLLWQDGKATAATASTEEEEKEGSAIRVTLLVNVWLNHIPATAEPPSAEMRAQMTPAAAVSTVKFRGEKEGEILTIKVGGGVTKETTWRFSGEGPLRYDVGIAVPDSGSIAVSTPTVELKFEHEGGGTIVKVSGKRKRAGNGEEGEGDGNEEEEEDEDGGDDDDDDSDDSEEESGEDGSEESDDEGEGSDDDDDDEDGITAVLEANDSEDDACYTAEYVHGGSDGEGGEGEEEQDCE